MLSRNIVKLLYIFLISIFLSLNTLKCLCNGTTTIINTNKKDVIQYILEFSIPSGWTIINVNDYQVSIKRDEKDLLKSFMYGSTFNVTPETRFIFNLVENKNNVIINVEGKIVTNPNSGFEKYTNYPDKLLQEFVNRIAKAFEGYWGYGFDLDKKIINYYVTDVTYKSNAFKSGLEVGDKIIKINDYYAKQIDYCDLSDYINAYNSDSKLNLIIRKPNQKENIQLVIPAQYFEPIMKKK